ncbi:hypothetical protein E2C01_014795 [Portunus trituberculatus]|uniref:Uncharacterized protein n=1 Tax=Portunus trituberculatus TaxID=210409 RepID=A0A5B7DLE2_PORTR|nr:hypothetical protein [Portunus trituberculatus]
MKESKSKVWGVGRKWLCYVSITSESPGVLACLSPAPPSVSWTASVVVITDFTLQAVQQEYKVGESGHNPTNPNIPRYPHAHTSPQTSSLAILP